MNDQNQQNDSECAGNSLSAQEATACPPPAASPADGRAVEREQNKNINTHNVKDSMNNVDGMAVSVTRHAANPCIKFFQYRIDSFGKCDLIFNESRYAGRESSDHANILPNSLPEKDEQNQLSWREVESGRECAQVWGIKLMNRFVAQTIDQRRKEVYNPLYGKSDRIKGLIKENNDGSI